MTDSANIVYGRLKEAAHISGYTFARTSEWLETLLADDAWRSVGPGFTDINQFLRSIDLSPFNIGDNRPGLVRRIKELQPDASNRAIANAVGASEGSVRNDLKPAQDYASEPHNNASDLLEDTEPAQDYAPAPAPEFDDEFEPETDLDEQAERLDRMRQMADEAERANPYVPIRELVDIRDALRRAIPKMRALRDAGQNVDADGLTAGIASLYKELEELL